VYESLSMYELAGSTRLSVEPHVARNTNKASVCRIHVQLQVVVFSNSSIRFMSSVVVTKTNRWFLLPMNALY
jgi:hypothetical protein